MRRCTPPRIARREWDGEWRLILGSSLFPDSILIDRDDEGNEAMLIFNGKEWLEGAKDPRAVRIESWGSFPVVWYLNSFSDKSCSQLWICQ